eukprot:9250026-Pyramimonas_sp.AAC.1
MVRTGPHLLVRHAVAVPRVELVEQAPADVLHAQMARRLVGALEAAHPHARGLVRQRVHVQRQVLRKLLPELAQGPVPALRVERFGYSFQSRVESKEIRATAEDARCQGSRTDNQPDNLEPSGRTSRKQKGIHAWSYFTNSTSPAPFQHGHSERVLKDRRETGAGGR